MSRTVSILEGNTFVVSDLDGNIDASPTQTHGLFQWDTRFLSRWKLSVNEVTAGRGNCISRARTYRRRCFNSNPQITQMTQISQKPPALSLQQSARALKVPQSLSLSVSEQLKD